MMSVRDIDALCECIYDAAIDPELWPTTLDKIAAAADSAWAALLTRRNDSWVGWSISPAAATSVDFYLRSEAAPRSVTTTRLFEIDHAGFISDEGHFSEEERRTDVFFQWANAHGYRNGAAMGIRLNSGDLAVVQLMRRSGSEPFRASELQRLDCFRPHLARAAMLAARWRMERLRAATEALALVGFPAVVLTADCRLVAANTLAEQLRDHLVWLARDGLALVDNAASLKLKRQVSSCAVSGSIESASSFPMWDKLRKNPMIVHVVPLKGERRDLFDGGLALVVYTSATAANHPSPDLIRELFDLTAAEARVATQLAEGRSVEQIASVHAVSTSTVRSQAKSILHKLGAHRQAEVAARLGALRPVSPMRVDQRKGD